MNTAPLSGQPNAALDTSRGVCNATLTNFVLQNPAARAKFARLRGYLEPPKFLLAALKRPMRLRQTSCVGLPAQRRRIHTLAFCIIGG